MPAEGSKFNSWQPSMIKRFFAPTIVLFLCLALGSCSSFSGYVADKWPTWLGGMPKDVPPRPGSPGYQEFIAHQQGKDATASAVPAAPSGAVPPTTAAPALAVPAAQMLPANGAQANDRAATQGGLY